MPPSPSVNARGFFAAPLWLAGFRPFFLLALIAGAVYPLLWALVFSGTLRLPAAGLTPLQWCGKSGSEHDFPQRRLARRDGINPKLDDESFVRPRTRSSRSRRWARA